MLPLTMPESEEQVCPSLPSFPFALLPGSATQTLVGEQSQRTG